MLKPRYECPPLDNPQAFQSALIDWFTNTAKNYPWRQTDNPYHILISEVMLQQTTVQSVIENRRFEKFIEEFPTPEDLANASEQEILRAWEGLGYYNRVRNLQKTAQKVCQEYGGNFPTTLGELKNLPGVGAYTSAAVASFAYNITAPLVDANVMRVFARLFDDHTEINSKPGQEKTWERAGILVSPDNPRAYNGALMELGQQICKNRDVDCLSCPVSAFCETREPLTLPKKKSKAKTTEVTEHALLIRHGKSKIFLQKGNESRRKGMWTLPLITAEEASLLPLIHESKYTITRYKVTLRVYEGEESPKLKGEWIEIGELENLPMPSPVRRVVSKLLEG